MPGAATDDARRLALGDADVRRCGLPSSSTQGPVKLVLVYFHGSGTPFRVEQERLFTPPRALRLLAAGVAVVLPASPLRDGAVHFWYSTDKDVLLDLLKKAKKQEEVEESTRHAEHATDVTATSASPQSAVDLLKDGEPAFLDHSRATAQRVVEEARNVMGLRFASVALGGFSQGAAVAMDAALHLPARPAALGFFSGSLMCRRRWRERLSTLKGWADLPLVQGHGRGDWAVGVNGGRWMRDFCRDEIGMQQAEYHEFQGGHTIPPDLADRFMEVLLLAAGAEST
ncbi:unnamed protein product [Symbiodinium natans]|uniref:Phospholipase/carboxylesterase/thioesterase domain-containing protein n=1 Tax=Symbiodinium natans TaxID=878477 RepID=A0A812RUZ5_9DINO|nr:unnamed protein product [Symbiodinium natans]